MPGRLTRRSKKPADGRGLFDLPFANLWQKEKEMLETIAVILVVLWLLGLVTSYTMGGLIHILLVIAVVVILIRVIQGRRL
jgi:hypothetical protein